MSLSLAMLMYFCIFAYGLQSFVPQAGLSILAKYRRPLLVHSEIQQDSEIHLEAKDDSDDARSYSTYLKTRPPSW
jgi:hypothetical protein